MSRFETPEQVRDVFGIAVNNAYKEFIPFKDGKPGFSIKRCYPPGIPFRPPVTKNGTPDAVAMIRVLYNPENKPEIELDLAKVPLWIDISKHCKYEYKHFGYNFDDEDCPTKESLADSNTAPAPADLQFKDEFFFDHSQNDFVNKDGKHMSGPTVLQMVFDEHCDTTLSQNRKLRRPIAHITPLCNSLLRALDWVLRVCFRKRFDQVRSPLLPFRRGDIVLLKADSLEIFGYKTTKNVILTYAALVLGVYCFSVWSGVSKNTFLSSIWANPLLALCAVLVTLPLLEHGGPHCIRILANILKRIRLWSILH